MGLSDELRFDHGAFAGSLAHGLTAACINDPRARLQRGPAAGGRAGRRAVVVYRRLPAGLEPTATAGWPPDGRDRRWLYSWPEPRRPFRSDRREKPAGFPPGSGTAAASSDCGI